MKRIMYLLGEALSGMRANRTSMMIGVVTTAFTITSFGVFALLYVNLKNMVGEVQDDVQFIVYLDEDLAHDRSQAIKKQLQSESAVASLFGTTQKAALEDFYQQFPSESLLLETLDENPLPASLTVTVRPGFQAPDTISAFVANVKALEGVQYIRYSQEWIDTLSLFVRYFELVALVIGCILALATVTIIANVIRLSFHARREEIEILRLIGGRSHSIAMPYLVEGSLLGMLGGGISLVLLKGGFEFFRLEFNGSGWFHGIDSTLIFFSIQEAVLLVIGGLVLGCGSSLFSVYGVMKSR